MARNRWQLRSAHPPDTGDGALSRLLGTESEHRDSLPCKGRGVASAVGTGPGGGGAGGSGAGVSAPVRGAAASTQAGPDGPMTPRKSIKDETLGLAANDGGGADDLLSQLAGEEIDRLLAEESEDAPTPVPAVSPRRERNRTSGRADKQADAVGSAPEATDTTKPAPSSAPAPVPEAIASQTTRPAEAVSAGPASETPAPADLASAPVDMGPVATTETAPAPTEVQDATEKPAAVADIRPVSESSKPADPLTGELDALFSELSKLDELVEKAATGSDPADSALQQAATEKRHAEQLQKRADAVPDSAPPEALDSSLDEVFAELTKADETVQLALNPPPAAPKKPTPPAPRPIAKPVSSAPAKGAGAEKGAVTPGVPGVVTESIEERRARKAAEKEASREKFEIVRDGNWRGSEDKKSAGPKVKDQGSVPESGVPESATGEESGGEAGDISPIGENAGQVMPAPTGEGEHSANAPVIPADEDATLLTEVEDELESVPEGQDDDADKQAAAEADTEVELQSGTEAEAEAGLEASALSQSADDGALRIDAALAEAGGTTNANVLAELPEPATGDSATVTPDADRPGMDDEAVEPETESSTADVDADASVLTKQLPVTAESDSVDTTGLKTDAPKGAANTPGAAATATATATATGMGGPLVMETGGAATDTVKPRKHATTTHLGPPFMTAAEQWKPVKPAEENVLASLPDVRRPRHQWLIRPLMIINRPFEFLTPEARDIMGKIAILTLVNAGMVICYVYFVKQ